MRDIMPTSGRLHLFDNFNLHEVYQAYKDVNMFLESVSYVIYHHFNQLWRLQFNNVVIPRNIVKVKPWNVQKLCTTDKKRFNHRKSICA